MPRQSFLCLNGSIVQELPSHPSGKRAALPVFQYDFIRLSIDLHNLVRADKTGSVHPDKVRL